MLVAVHFDAYRMEIVEAMDRHTHTHLLVQIMYRLPQKIWWIGICFYHLPSLKLPLYMRACVRVCDKGTAIDWILNTDNAHIRTEFI